MAKQARETADDVACPIEDQLQESSEIRCVRGCSCAGSRLGMLVVALGFGAFHTCFPAGAMGIAWLMTCSDSWLFILLAEMLALLATALGTLLFKRAMWEDPAFPHALLRRIAYALVALCQAVGFVSGRFFPSPVTSMLLALITGAAMSYLLLMWFEALQVVYRRSGRESCIMTLMLVFFVEAVLGLAPWVLRNDALLTGGILAMLGISALCIEATENGRGDLGRFASGGNHGGHGAYRLSKHAVPVLVGFGVMWGLACSLVVESTTQPAPSMSEVLGVLGATGTTAFIIAAFRAGAGDHIRFGFIIRSTIVVNGILWVLVPVLAEMFPSALGAVGVVALVLTGSSMTLFSIEIAREYGLSIASVMPVNYIVFVVAACAAGAVYALTRTAFVGPTAWSVVVAFGVTAALVATPLLPSNASDATMFTLSELPENEGYDERVERARSTFSVKYGLTDRETEVFELLVQGMSRERIADELSISAWTVKDHVGKIYAKAQVHSAKELMNLVAGAHRG